MSGISPRPSAGKARQPGAGGARAWRMVPSPATAGGSRSPSRAAPRFLLAGNGALGGTVGAAILPASPRPCPRTRSHPAHPGRSRHARGGEPPHRPRRRPRSAAEVDPELLSLPGAAQARADRRRWCSWCSPRSPRVWMARGALRRGALRAHAGAQPIDVGDLTLLRTRRRSREPLRPRHRPARDDGGDPLRPRGRGRLVPPRARRGQPDALGRDPRARGLRGPALRAADRVRGPAVPFRRAGVRHAGLSTPVHDADRRDGARRTPGCWSTAARRAPRAGPWRWPPLFARFALWNLGGVARVLTRVRDERKARPGPRVETAEAVARLTRTRASPHACRAPLHAEGHLRQREPHRRGRSAGRTISDIAAELGIAVCREEFAGTGIGNYTVWVKGARRLRLGARTSGRGCKGVRG